MGENSYIPNFDVLPRLVARAQGGIHVGDRGLLESVLAVNGPTSAT